MAEMLVQSHMSYIELLPALPDAWPSGQISGICARGGFVLNINWQQGKLQQLTVTATSNGTCELKYQQQTVKFAAQKGKTYQFNGALQRI
jgi:alpha-L-fucosidase 2